MTQKDIINEIKEVQKKRRQEWQRIPGEDDCFLFTNLQKQYDTLKAALEVFEAMTLAEFQKITTRAERQRQEAEKQTTLFK